MAYAAKQDMLDRFDSQELIDLTDDDGLAIDDVEIDTALTDASDLIDSILAVRYALPLAPVPNVLTTFTCDIARYELYDEDPGEHVKDKRDFAIKQLEKYAAGKLDFGPDGPAKNDPDPGADGATGSPQHCAPDPIFSRDTLKGF
ncbi:MAG: DUF1320 domain-containing protein [Alphaproteobacteria bacterium]